MPRIARVVPEVSLDRAFDYTIPEELISRVAGQRELAPPSKFSKEGGLRKIVFRGIRSTLILPLDRVWMLVSCGWRKGFLRTEFWALAEALKSLREEVLSFS